MYPTASVPLQVSSLISFGGNFVTNGPYNRKAKSITICAQAICEGLLKCYLRIKLLSNYGLRDEALWRVFVGIKLSLKGTECSLRPETDSSQPSSSSTVESSLNTDPNHPFAHFFSFITTHADNDELESRPLPRHEERLKTHVRSTPEANSASHALKSQGQLGLTARMKHRTKLLVAILLSQYAAPIRGAGAFASGRGLTAMKCKLRGEPRKIITVMSRTL